MYEQIEALGSFMPGGFFIYRADEDQDIVYANDIVLDIFGCKSMDEFRELTGNRFPGMIFPEDRSSVLQSIDSQVASSRKNLDHIEYRIKRKDGVMRWVDDYGRLVNIDALGEVFFVLIRDITDKYNERKEKLRMELDLQKQKNANEIRSTFLFNVSHDIRTPMNAIKGFTDLAILNIDDKEKVRDYLEKVDQSNKHMMTLIDDLLEMSRLDYGKIDIKEDKCDLEEVIVTAYDCICKEAGDKGVIIEQEVDISNKLVLADTSRITRILNNILDNAVKFNHPGGKVKLSLHQKKRSYSGYARYEIEVSDNGIGMSEEFLTRIYQAFEREESSTRSGYLGTGLGLSITKKLIDCMGGSISVDSKKGEGTTFKIGLPLKVYDHDKKPAPSVESSDHKAAGEYRILLVEDIEINRLLAENVLKSAGFLVESVEDGSDAVSIISDRPVGYYDLILMDIQMPVMSGYEATRAIRALGREDTRRIPIIALSANAGEEDKRMSVECGMNTHIAKPFDIAHLIGTVNDYIESNAKSVSTGEDNC